MGPGRVDWDQMSCHCSKAETIIYQLRLSVHGREFIFSIHLKLSVSHLLTVGLLLEAEYKENRTGLIQFHCTHMEMIFMCGFDADD